MHAHCKENFYIIAMSYNVCVYESSGSVFKCRSVLTYSGVEKELLCLQEALAVCRAVRPGVLEALSPFSKQAGREHTGVQYLSFFHSLNKATALQ